MRKLTGKIFTPSSPKKDAINNVFIFAEKEFENGNVEFDFLESILEDNDSFKLLKKDPKLFYRFYQLYDKMITAVSEQLTTVSRYLFIKIPKNEFKSKNKEDKYILSNFEHFHNYIADFVRYQILMQKDSYVNRILIIERWALILKKCYEAEDYNMSLALYAGLSSLSIARLSKGISEETTEILEKVGKFTESVASQKEIKETLLKNCAIPYLGLYQTALERLQEAISLSHIVNPSKKGEESFENKDEKFESILVQIRALQHTNKVIMALKKKSLTEPHSGMYFYNQNAIQLKVNLCKKYRQFFHYEESDLLTKKGLFFSKILRKVNDPEDVFYQMSIEIQKESAAQFSPMKSDAKKLIFIYKLMKNGQESIQKDLHYQQSKKTSNIHGFLAEKVYDAYQYMHFAKKNDTDDINSIIIKKLSKVLHVLQSHKSIQLKQSRIEHEILQLQENLKKLQFQGEHEGMRYLLILFNAVKFIAATIKSSETLTENLLESLKDNLVRVHTDGELRETTETTPTENRRNSFSA